MSVSQTMDRSTARSEGQRLPDAVKPPPEGSMYLLGRSLCRLLLSTLFDFKIYGSENVPKRGGLLLVCNHESFLDPPAVGVALRRQIHFFAKAELFKNNIFGRLIRSVNAFPVRQGEADLAAIREAIKRMKEGRALLAFPEGGRSHDGNLQPLQPGVALMIRRANVPVVPAAIDGSFEAWAPGQGRFVPYPVRILFGKPMRLAHLPPEQILTILDQQMRQLLSELRSTPHPCLKPRHFRRQAEVRVEGARLAAEEAKQS